MTTLYHPAPATPGTTTASDRAQRLAYHETIVRRGMAAFAQAGTALEAIRREKLYEPDFSNFQSYCQARLSLSKRHANRLIRAADLVRDLGSLGERLATESHARALLEVSSDNRETVLAFAIKTGRDTTAEGIRDAARELGLLPERLDRPPAPSSRLAAEAGHDPQPRRAEAQEADAAGAPATPPSPTSAIVSRSEFADEYWGDVPTEVVIFPDYEALQEVTPAGGEPIEADLMLPVVQPPTHTLQNAGDVLVAVPVALIPQVDRLNIKSRDALVPLSWLRTHAPELDPATPAGLAVIRQAYRDGGYVGKFNKTNDSVGWAHFTFNPITGCLHDCDYCYARDIAKRFYGQGFVPTIYPGRLDMIGHTKLPGQAVEDDAYRRVFAGSMGDLFGRWVPAEFIEATLAEMATRPDFTFLLLTKFPRRLPDFSYPPNVWVGTTIDTQARVAEVEQAYARVEASVRWVSFEPLLESVVLTRPELVDHYVIGAQSRASRVREFQPEWPWVEALLAQARSAGASVYFKENLRAVPREMPTPRLL